QIAKAMKALELSFDLILSSPYVRARETAEIVADSFKAQELLELTETLIPGGDCNELISSLLRKRPVPDSVLLVGHEPSLSELISFLVSGGRSFPVVMK